METPKQKASQKLAEYYLITGHIHKWQYQKIAIKWIIQQHINNAYMIDQRYYKEYINLYHDMLIILNEL